MDVVGINKPTFMLTVAYNFVSSSILGFVFVFYFSSRFFSKGKGFRWETNPLSLCTIHV